MNNDTIIIMGNGPSLKDVDFDMLDEFDTFGLNVAYRMYDRINWWPKYHASFDYVVTESHKENYINLINDSPIEKCFYIVKLVENHPKFQFINLQTFGTTNKWNNSPAAFNSFHDNGSSGANASSVAACLGYKKIVLLGVDCNYVEFVEGSTPDGVAVLKMKKTPDTNLNYWFDDYQQEGDRYSTPDGMKFHLPTWNKFAYRAAHAGIEIINCSPISNLRCFKMMSLEEALKDDT